MIEKVEAEGGCGVIGAASSVPIAGRHFLAALRQMRNRGNGKGGGVAMLGLSPQYLGVSREILSEDYLIQVAYLDPGSRSAVEGEFIRSYFDIDHEASIAPVSHWKDFGLEVAPPYVHRYFVKVKPSVLKDFSVKNGFAGAPPADPQDIADEFVFQNTYALNKKFYASLGDKKAFVLCHGKNLLVFKIVGYGEDAMRCYGLEQIPAHTWIGHHRYPTKGRLWHPGGAHPFIGLHEALVHNGDFSNYHSVSEYLAQHNIFPLFLTDTEVSVYLFDLWRRVYRYPMEYVIEALAPTTERDFHQLDEERRRVYREIQAAHIHGSPDGPWFFIVGLSEEGGKVLNLLGITDTSMLRPQVFALQEGEVKIGLIASERQAIDACLESLAEEDGRFAGKADLYWNARGGSFTDGGAFNFRLAQNGAGYEFSCVDKFGKTIAAEPKNHEPEMISRLEELADARSAPALLAQGVRAKTSFRAAIEDWERQSLAGMGQRREVFESLSWLLDNWALLPFGQNGRERARVEAALTRVLRGCTSLGVASEAWLRIDWTGRQDLRPPKKGEEVLILDVAGFPAEGDESAAILIAKAYQLGWRRVISFAWRGQRFCGSGLGANSGGFRIDTYGNPGDYLGSGLDGAHLFVHGSAQDQVAQIMKSGRLVIYGDVGQAFMYGAKGGDVFVMGQTAGRPLINAVGRPHVVVNGTCLDYLAESFMAGDPLDGGGFCVVNGMRLGAQGRPQPLPWPYPGSNLLSLASGGAIYVRDPRGLVRDDQLNGGRIVEPAEHDERILESFLKENERVLGIRVREDLLKDGDRALTWRQAYRKVEPVREHV